MAISIEELKYVMPKIVDKLYDASFEYNMVCEKMDSLEAYEKLFDILVGIVDDLNSNILMNALIHFGFNKVMVDIQLRLLRFEHNVAHIKEGLAKMKKAINRGVYYIASNEEDDR